jgi:hypothetical protein
MLHQLGIEGFKWPTKEITWWIRNPEGFPGVTSGAVINAFAMAWQWWADVCDIHPRMVQTERDALVRIECAPIDGPMKTLAWSELANQSLTPKRQRYDSGEAWVVSETPTNRQIDLARVACHEIGHVLGIPHISAGNLLAPTYSSRVRVPQAGDIAEAVRRYGPPQQRPTPQPPTPVPPTVGAVTLTLGADLVTAQLRAQGWTVTPPGGQR